MIEETPVARPPPPRRSASARLSAIGFSSSRCLPAAAARSASAAWTSGGSAIDDGVHLGQQGVEVGVPRDVELGADTLGLGDVPPPDADELRVLVLGQAGRVDPLRPETGAEDAEPHGQTAPNWRSPASPSPGTM